MSSINQLMHCSQPVIPLSSSGSNIREIHCWLIDDQEVQLLQKGEKLICKKINTITKQEKEYPIEVPGLTNQEIQSYLLKCDPVINEEGKVDFCVPLHNWDTGKERVISLLRAPEDLLIWQVYDRVTRKAYQYQLALCKGRCLEERVCFLKTLTSDEIFKNLKSLSKIDKKTVIDADSCALTVLSTGKDWYGHAVVAIEGHKQGIPYLWYAHLRGHGSHGTGKAEVVLEKERRLKAFSQTKTWIRPKEKEEKIIQLLEWEIGLQEKREPWVFFNILGGDSKGVKPVKAREFKTCEEFEAFLKTLAPFDNFTGTILTPLMDKEKKAVYVGDSKSVIIKYETDEKGLGLLEYLPDESLNFAVSVNEDMKRGKNFEIWIQPDNCMTWARKIVSLADIYLKSGNKAYTMPIEYTAPHFSRSKAGKGNERFLFPFVCGGYYYQADYTDEIQRQVGPYSWKLTEQSRGLLESTRNGFRGVIELFVTDFQKAILDGDTKLTITVEVNGSEKEIDLSEAFKQNYLLEMKKQNERFVFPLVCGSNYYQVDYTDEIERQVGPHPWRLTANSRCFLEYGKDKEIIEERINGFQKAILEGEDKFIITVEVNSSVKEIDLSEVFKRNYLSKQRDKEFEEKTAQLLSTQPFPKAMAKGLKLAYDHAKISAEERAKQKLEEGCCSII